jgi:RNA polymerase sigma factor (sigma-70 family)
MSPAQSITAPSSRGVGPPDPGVGAAIDWAAAYRSHEDSLRGLATKRMGEEATSVDDVMQEVALAVMNSNASARPDDPEKIGPWLRTITIHKVQDFWRKVQRTRQLRDRLEGNAAHSAAEVNQSPFDWVLRVESIAAVRQALEALESPERDLLEQKYRQNLTCRELAAREGVAIKTIEYRLKRARDQMRRILNKRFPLT